MSRVGLQVTVQLGMEKWARRRKIAESYDEMLTPL